MTQIDEREVNKMLKKLTIPTTNIKKDDNYGKLVVELKPNLYQNLFITFFFLLFSGVVCIFGKEMVLPVFGYIISIILFCVSIYALLVIFFDRLEFYEYGIVHKTSFHLFDKYISYDELESISIEKKKKGNPKKGRFQIYYRLIRHGGSCIYTFEEHQYIDVKKNMDNIKENLNI